MGQYYRGDKSWQTLDKTAVGLANVDNTSDASKPISTATQNALNAKAPLASPTFTGTVTVRAPSNGTDASTKAYVDTQVVGIFVRKTVDTAVTSNVTRTSDPHLTCSVVANGVYKAEMMLIYDADTAGDLSMNFIAPSDATFDWCISGLPSSAIVQAGYNGSIKQQREALSDSVVVEVQVLVPGR